MPGFLGTFVSGVAASMQGQEMLADLDEKKAETENRKTDTQMKQMQLLQQKKTAEGQNDVQQWMQQNAKEQAQPGADGAQQITQMQAAKVNMYAKGDFAGAEIMDGLIKNKASELKDIHVAQQQQKLEAQTKLSDAATAYVGNPSPQAAEQVVKAAVAAGVDPLTIPKPGDLKLPTWVKQQQLAPLSAKERVDFTQKQLDFDRSFEEKKQEFKEREEDKHEQMAMTAQNQAAMRSIQREGLELRREMAEDRRDDKEKTKAEAKDKSQFNQADKIIKETQPLAKPYLSDLSTITDIKNKLADGGSAAEDQQIHQMLTGLHSDMKGRATNLYYKDNANFGATDERLAGFLSHTFTGRYSDAQRKEIYEMLDKSQTRVIEPALTRLENDAKERGKKWGIDPDKISIGGDFTRSLGPKTTKDNDRSAGGRLDTGEGKVTVGKEPGKPSAPEGTKPPPQYREGMTATNPKTGQTLTYKDGKWQ